MESDKEKLKNDHTPAVINERLSKKNHPSYLRDAVLGSIDGAVTTFAIVAGAAGGGFQPDVALTLGVANLIADGFSMAVSNYQSSQSRSEELEKAKESELRQIKIYPEGEREEIRQIFSKKGFEGEILERIVETITQNRQRWVETMMQEELGMESGTVKPLYAALWTLSAFILVGCLPLVPFFLNDVSMNRSFAASAILTGAAFFSVGIVKGLIVKHPVFRSGIQTLLLGSLAASLAFITAFFIHSKV